MTLKLTAQPDSKKKLMVFLSHASEDKPKVRRLCKQLKQNGFDPWLDEERILPGQNWNLEIEKALHVSDIILLCFSIHSLQKAGYIQREYRRAMKYQEEKPDGVIFVIPVRLDGCKMPDFVQELQWVDYPEQYDRLVMALNQRLVESDLPPVAIIPHQIQKRVEIILDGEFSEFTPSRQQDIVSVLAALLRVESNQIRVLTVYEGSIVIIIEMPDIVANRFYEIARDNDKKIRTLGINSILIEGREIIKLSDETAQIDTGLEQFLLEAKTNPLSIVEEIKSRIDIVDLVSEAGVKLRKAGRNYIGFCPFHDNRRTPAFVVWSETGTWKCFGQCNEGGDIFKFIMKKQGLDFKEALHRLAERAGVEVQQYTPQQEAEVQAIKTVSPSYKTELYCLGILFRRPQLLHRLDRQLQETGLQRLVDEDFEYTDHQILLDIIRQSLEQYEVDHHQYVLSHLPDMLQGLAEDLLNQTEKLDPVEERLLDELQRSIIKLRRMGLNESLNQLRFMLEEAYQQGDLRATSYQEQVLQHTRLLRDLDYAGRKLSLRRIE